MVLLLILQVDSIVLLWVDSMVVPRVEVEVQLDCFHHFGFLHLELLQNPGQSRRLLVLALALEPMRCCFQLCCLQQLSQQSQLYPKVALVRVGQR